MPGTQEEWDALEARVYDLAGQAEEAPWSVAEQIGGLSLDTDPRFPRKYHLVSAVASKIIPDEYYWEISCSIGGDVKLYCAGYQPAQPPVQPLAPGTSYNAGFLTDTGQQRPE